MKIGYFTHGSVSTSETFIYDLMKGLEKKCELTWFCGQRVIEKKIVDHQIATGYSTLEAKIPFWAYKIGQLKGSNGYKFRMALRLFLSKKQLEKIKTTQFPDIAYVEYLTSAVLLRSFFEENHIPYVVHAHGYDISSELKDPEYRKELKKVFTSVSKVVAASYFIKRLLILEGCPSKKIQVVRLGIDTDAIVPLPWKERFKNIPSVIFLGRLTEKKNPIALIHAFALVRKKIPDVKFTIIGDGPLLQDVKARISSLKLEKNITLMGALPRDKAFPIMNNHWIYAQHSVTAISGDKEGYAISPAEAAAHELAVVSTLHNGIPEHVKEGITGFLVPEFDYESMAQRIIQLIENPTLAEEMGKAGRENIITLNDPDKRIDCIFGLLREIYNERV